MVAPVSWRLACASAPAEGMPDGALGRGGSAAPTFICLREEQQADAVWHIYATRLCPDQKMKTIDPLVRANNVSFLPQAARCKDAAGSVSDESRFLGGL